MGIKNQKTTQKNPTPNLSYKLKDITEVLGFIVCDSLVISNLLEFCFIGEKRKNNEPYSLEDSKRPRVVGDIPIELINEVMSTITDPAAMLGPEVRYRLGVANGLFVNGLFLVDVPHG